MNTAFKHCRISPTARIHSPLLLIAFLLSVIIASDAFAQPRGNNPHIAYAYPAGCQRGTACEIVVGGQHLKEAKEVYLAGEGVEVEIVSWYRPLTSGEYNNLRNKMRDAREQLIEERKTGGDNRKPSEAEVALAAGITNEQLKEMEVYRQRDRDPKRQPNDQLEEEVTLQLSVAEDAEPGKRELRFLTDAAISNPIWLHVGRWPEGRENEPNDNKPNEAVDSMPMVINGQIMPGDTDRFSFHASKGMKLVIQVEAREVIPYLADAVPGWFQAVLRLTDSSGKEVSFSDSFHYRQDPVMYFEVPEDDVYTVEIRDSLYRGREDFVYRITLGEIPFITSIFPLGARVDSDVSVQLSGWNLTRPVLTVKTMSRKQYRPIRWYSSEQDNGVSVRFPLQIDHWPEVTDREPNNDFANAQEIKTRMTINGRIDQPGDKDVFLIDGGGPLVVEVHARRLGSPLDSILTLTDAEGNEVAFNDDHKDMSQAMLTHHADSHLTASVPANGNYYLQIADAQDNGGSEFTYRLVLRPKQADYELRVTPSSIIARAGQVVPITAFALRKDGFDEDVELSLVDPPKGFRLDGAVIPGNADHVRMTLTMPSTAPAESVVLEMEGAAKRGVRSRTSIVRPAIPAENMMQAFIWYHLVPVEKWNVFVSGKPGARMPFKLLTNNSLTLPRGGDVYINVQPLAKKLVGDQFKLQLSEPPEGISAAIETDDSGAFAVKISTTEEVEPELRGNLLMSAYKEFTPAPTEENPAPRTQRTNYGFLPAIPFEVSKRSRTDR